MASTVWTPRNYEIKDIPEFVREYRYVLIHLIEVEKVLPWLTHIRVIDKYDVEIIFSRYTTSVMRAGHLVDLLEKRGTNAINALLEIIEYDYKDAFEKITGRKPQPPPEGYRQCDVRYSTMSEMIGEDIQNLFPLIRRGYLETQEEKTRLEQVAIVIQNCLQNELDRKQNQILELTQTILEHREMNKTLRLQCDSYKQERDLAWRECTDIREKKDAFQMLLTDKMKENEELRTKLYNMDKVRHNTEMANAQDKEQLQKELEYYKGHDVVGYETSLDEEIMLLKHERNNQTYNQMQVDQKPERDQIMKQKNECEKKVMANRTNMLAAQTNVSNQTSSSLEAESYSSTAKGEPHYFSSQYQRTSESEWSTQNTGITTECNAGRKALKRRKQKMMKQKIACENKAMTNLCNIVVAQTITWQALGGRSLGNQMAGRSEFSHRCSPMSPTSTPSPKNNISRKTWKRSMQKVKLKSQTKPCFVIVLVSG